MSDWRNKNGSIIQLIPSGFLLILRRPINRDEVVEETVVTNNNPEDWNYRTTPEQSVKTVKKTIQVFSHHQTTTIHFIPIEEVKRLSCEFNQSISGTATILSIHLKDIHFKENAEAINVSLVDEEMAMEIMELFQTIKQNKR